MNAPQVIVCCLAFGGFILSCAKAGESKGTYKPVEFLISIGIEFGLLWWGGFFK